MSECSWAKRVGLAGAGALLLIVGVTPAVALATDLPADLAVNQAYVAGGATSAEYGQSLTFVFGARNKGPGVADVSINLVTIRGLQRTALQCVLPNGGVINPDGNNCEPGETLAGHSAGHLVLTGTVTGTSNIVVRACVTDLSGATDPVSGNNCKRLRVTLL
jgi:hypothetical protein